MDADEFDRRDVVRTDTGLVALSTTPDNPGDGPVRPEGLEPPTV